MSCNLPKSTVSLDISTRLGAQFKSTDRMSKLSCLATQVAVGKLRSETMCPTMYNVQYFLPIYRTCCYPLDQCQFFLNVSAVSNRVQRYGSTLAKPCDDKATIFVCARKAQDGIGIGYIPAAFFIRNLDQASLQHSIVNLGSFRYFFLDPLMLIHWL